MPTEHRDDYPVFPPKSTRHVLPIRVFGPWVDLDLLKSDASAEDLTKEIRGELRSRGLDEVEFWPEGIRLDRWYSEPVIIFDPDDVHRVCEKGCQHAREEKVIASTDTEDILKSTIDRFTFVPNPKLIKHEQTNETDAQLIRKSMEKEGRWVVPMVVSRQRSKYLVIDGMHRTEAARKLGVKLVPCIDYDYEKEVHLGRWLRVLTGWTSKGFYKRIAKLERDDAVQLMKLSDSDLTKRGGFLRLFASDLAVLWIEDKNNWTVFTTRTPWQQSYTPIQAYRALLARIDSAFGFDPRTRRSLKGHYVGEEEQPVYLGHKRQIIIYPPVLTNSQLLESMKGALSS